MSSIETLTTFLGWCTVLNMGMLALTAILVMAMPDTMARIHNKMFGVSEGDLPRIYFQYMAQYQLATYVLNLAPYVALKLISFLGCAPSSRVPGNAADQEAGHFALRSYVASRLPWPPTWPLYPEPSFTYAGN